MFNGFLSSLIRSVATVLPTVAILEVDGDNADDDADADNDDDCFCATFFETLVSRSLRLSAKCFCLFSGCCAPGFTTAPTGDPDCVFTWLLSIDVLTVGDTIFDLPLLSAAMSAAESFLHFAGSFSIRRFA